MLPSATALPAFVPPPELIRRFTSLSLYFKLSCPGAFDQSCPYW